MADTYAIGDAAYRACVYGNIGYSQGSSRADLNSLTVAEACDGRALNTDCSALAAWCWKIGGAAPASFNIINLWTGNQRELAREWGGTVLTYTGPSMLQTGDTLWRDGHTAIVHEGYVCEAYIAETGTIYGTRGDTANETRVTPIAQYPLYKMTAVIRFPNTGGGATSTTTSEEQELMSVKDEILSELRADLAYQNKLIAQLRSDLGTTQKLVKTNRNRLDAVEDQLRKDLGYINQAYLDPTKQGVARIEKKLG